MNEVKARDRRLSELHDIGAALHKVGALDKVSLRGLEAFCLTKPLKATPQDENVLPSHLPADPKIG